MWQSTISLRYVSYKNADSNLHERICPMMAKNLLWSCAQIVAPRPPINPQRPNHAMERTTDRCAVTFEMTSTPPLRAPRALVRRRSSCVSLDHETNAHIVHGDATPCVFSIEHILG